MQGFDTDIHDNYSVTKLRQWLQEVDPDVFLGCESQINWAKMPWEGQLSNWFRTEESKRMVVGYNIHESHLHDRRQYGGTFLMVLGPASDRVVETGVDPSGLGRWCWVRFSSSGGSSTTVFVAYRPVRQSREHLLSTYMQHSRYFESIGDRTCPRRAFMRDIETEIAHRIITGDKIVVAGDFNENTSVGPLYDAFLNLGLREATFPRFPNHPLPATMSRGRFPVDAVWLSSDLPVEASTWLSFVFSPGDHRAAVVDFDMEGFLGRFTECHGQPAVA